MDWFVKLLENLAGAAWLLAHPRSSGMIGNGPEERDKIGEKTAEQAEAGFCEPKSSIFSHFT